MSERVNESNEDERRSALEITLILIQPDIIGVNERRHAIVEYPIINTPCLVSSTSTYKSVMNAPPPFFLKTKKDIKSIKKKD